MEYSKGKFESELDLRNSNKNFVILRLGSLYGKSYDSTRLNIMPNLFSKMTASETKIKLFSEGKQLKSLVSVVDVARAMEFVASEKHISNEVFNIVNENLTVKQVANICQKINKNLEVVSTNDPVPNEGYTLSNNKIKSKGFNFLYKIENSIEEMVDSWRVKEIQNNNETLEVGIDNYEDERGIISNYYMDDSINMIGYVESKSRTMRGNHYHQFKLRNVY